MRTSHREIRRRIEEEKQSIPDEEFFSSEAYRLYLSDITEAATGRYLRPIPVTVIAEPDDPLLACTDLSGIWINACNEITWSFPTRRLRSLSIVGLNAHENAHCLYTDVAVWDECFRAAKSGSFYPARPEGLSAEEEGFADEIRTALADGGRDPVPRAVLLDALRCVANTLEDAYVDGRYSREFPGIPARGIALNDLRIAERAPDVTEMLRGGCVPHSVILNLLIQHANGGEVCGGSAPEADAYVDLFRSLLPLADASSAAGETTARCEASWRILIRIWPLIRRCFESLRSRTEEASSPSEAGAAAEPGGDPPPDASSGPPAEASGPPSRAAGDGDAEAAVRKALAGERTKTAADFPVEASVSSGRKKRAPAKGGKGADAPAPPAGLPGPGDDGAGEDRALERLAEDVAKERLEERLAQTLRNDAEAIRCDGIHRGVRMTLHRAAKPEPAMVEAYAELAPPLLALSKRLQKSVRTVLADRRQGGRRSGLLAGKRLDPRALHRDDGKIFRDARLPSEPADLAVALLLDESGSMGSGERIECARAAAIVVQDFCENLEIPCLILGHTAFRRSVELFSYADFDSADRQDRYRLMGLSPRHCNRDGAALRYAAERLLRCGSEVKLLLVVCDGQPNDLGYSGPEAEEDLRNLRTEYERKGVRICAAAIGDDRERIERIYGSGFLDITRAERLPVMLTQLIARSIP